MRRREPRPMVVGGRRRGGRPWWGARRWWRQRRPRWRRRGRRRRRRRRRQLVRGGAASDRIDEKAEGTLGAALVTGARRRHRPRGRGAVTAVTRSRRRGRRCWRGPRTRWRHARHATLQTRWHGGAAGGGTRSACEARAVLRGRDGARGQWRAAARRRRAQRRRQRRVMEPERRGEHHAAALGNADKQAIAPRLCARVVSSVITSEIAQRSVEYSVPRGKCWMRVL